MQNIRSLSQKLTNILRFEHFEMTRSSRLILYVHLLDLCFNFFCCIFILCCFVFCCVLFLCFVFHVICWILCFVFCFVRQNKKTESQTDRKNTAKRNMSSAVCASSMYSCICMKMSSFLFVHSCAMPRMLYLSCGIPFPV